VGDERPRRCTAVHGLQHRRLHLEVAARVEERADVAGRARPQPEDVAHVRVHRQIGVALPGAQLGIGQLPVPFALRVLLAERQRTQRLGEQGEALHPQRDFTGLGPEQRALDADPLHELGQLLAARRLDEAGHAACLPKRLRYASMNGSRSPSITFCTSATLSSVRWSLTIVYGWNT